MERPDASRGGPEGIVKDTLMKAQENLLSRKTEGTSKGDELSLFKEHWIPGSRLDLRLGNLISVDVRA